MEDLDMEQAGDMFSIRNQTQSDVFLIKLYGTRAPDGITSISSNIAHAARKHDFGSSVHADATYSIG